ncbi:MAG: hypothetical protein GY797_10485 [Deltaproteobacteria bacterium]|nr:hypothetical protein [Deltaproteobacteria bacterium]
MKKWRCTVCGYIHKGPEPPDKCPVCGADKSEFEEVIEPITGIGEGLQDDAKTDPVPEVPAAKSPPDTGARDSGLQPAAFSGGLIQKVIGLMLKHHVHPVSVHIPNGVLPVSVIFIILAVLFESSALQTAALYNMVFVVLTIPFVLFSGYIEWQNRYEGALTRRFIAKIIAASVVAITSIIAVAWWIMVPDVLQASYPARWTFIALILIMLIAATVSGFIGGKLVFKE